MNLFLHVLPRWDSLSNFVRVHRQPFCSSWVFFRLVAQIVGSHEKVDGGNSVALHPPLRLWEVGANLGDCGLSAAAMMRSAGMPVLVELYEPLKENAMAIQRSVVTSGLDDMVHTWLHGQSWYPLLPPN